MPKFKCPIPACTFETDNLDPVIMAALVTTHAKVHDNTMTSAKVGRVKRPTVSSAGREGQGRAKYCGTGRVMFD